MFCRYCGEEILKGSRFCQHCGKDIATSSLAGNSEIKSNIIKSDTPQKVIDADKSFLGVVSFFTLFILGLIIGLFLYPFGSYRQKSFLKGWFISLIIVVILIFIIYLLIVSSDPGLSF